MPFSVLRLGKTNWSRNVHSADSTGLGVNSPHQLVGAVIGKAQAAWLYRALETSGHAGKGCGGNLWQSPTPCSETASLGFQNLQSSQCILRTHIKQRLTPLKIHTITHLAGNRFIPRDAFLLITLPGALMQEFNDLAQLFLQAIRLFGQRLLLVKRILDT